MDSEIEQVMDTVWSSSLERMMKKDIPPMRPSLGDFVDLYVPQIRTLLLMEANPVIVKVIYDAAYASASRNTFVIMKKLGMPADYFWKFEYWPRERAFETLRKVINKVFWTMMNRNKEGGLELTGVEIEPVRFTIAFKDCVECAGVSVNKAICFYHTATFAGILASLINKEMDAYETKCRGRGDDSCVIVIGKRDDPEIVTQVREYLTPGKIEAKLDERLNTCLQGNQTRDMGNLVDIGYYNLMLLSSVLANPELASQSTINIGVDYGTRMMPVVSKYYQDNSLEVLKKYYSQLHHLDVKSIEQSGNDIIILLSECAEDTTRLKRQELVNFLFGELQGLICGLLNKQVVYKESSFEDNNLRIKFSLSI